MGRHVSEDRRRRVAAWPIIVVVAALVLAGLAVAYFVILDRSKKSAACSGSTVLPVVASPGAARAVNQAATAFNATTPVARSTCVTVTVDTVAGVTAEAALAGGWKGQKTQAPGLWVVDSAADLAALDASNSAMTAGHTNTDLATSPVVVAVKSGTSGAGVTWGSLASGAAGGFVLGIPGPESNRASSYALQSMIAASQSTSTITSATVTAAAPMMNRLAGAVPSQPATTQAGLTDLAAGSAGFSAVPVVESDLAAFNAAHPPGLTALYPTGATVGDEVVAAPLSAPWVTDAMSDAAAAFDAFLGDPQGIAIFTANDLRTTSPPPSATGVDLATPVTPLPDAPVAVRQAINAAWASALTTAPGTAVSTAAPPATIAPTTIPPTVATTTPPTSTATRPTTTPPKTAPAKPTPPKPTTKPTPKPTTTKPVPPGPVITLLLDTSGSMDTVEDGQQRITWMQNAVYGDLAQAPTNWFGAWSFSTEDGPAGYSQLVPTGALTDQVNGATRSAAITSAVKALTPGGDSWTYAAIQAAYTSAVNSAVAGRPNRLIVITDGPDTTPGLSRATLVANISALAAQNKNVALDVIGLSQDVSSDAMTEITKAGGGTYTPLNSLADLQPTLNSLSAPG
jgi:hypothetical protein